MPRVGAYEAWIECDNAPLCEYKPECAGSSASCWVPSEADKRFVIAIHTHEGADERVAVKMDIDGVGVQNLWLLKSERRISHLKGLNIGRDKLKAFSFRVISLTDSDDGRYAGPPDIGALTLKFFRCEVEKEGEESQECRNVTLPEEPVHETLTKAKSHRVQLSRETTNLPVGLKHKTHSVITFDDEPPLATLRFCYQPREVLIANGIIEDPIMNQNYERCASSPLRYLNEEPEPNVKKVVKKEDLSPSPSSTLCEPSRSPSADLKRKRAVEEGVPCKRTKGFSKSGAGFVIKKDEDRDEKFLPKKEEDVEEDDDKRYLQLLAQREALDVEIKRLRRSKSRKIKQEVKCDPDQDLQRLPTSAQYFVDASGVIDLTLCDP